jgi:hypothetical protein
MQYVLFMFFCYDICMFLVISIKFVMLISMCIQLQILSFELHLFCFFQAPIVMGKFFKIKVQFPHKILYVALT